MAMEVDLALNARRFQAGTKDAEKALEDLQDVVDDFKRDATDAGEEAADSFNVLSDMAGDAERSIDDLSDAAKDAEREFRDAGRAAEDFGRDAEGAGDDARRGLDKAGEGLDDFKSEAASSGREAAASFSGEFDDVTDLVQEVAANAFGGFGPAGAAAGLAAAVGVGLVSAAFTQAEEDAEASKEAAASWAQTWIDNGGRVLSAMTLQSNMNDIIGDTERWAEVQQIAAAAGVDESLALRALAGDALAYSTIQSELTQAQDANTAAIAATGDEMTAMAEGLYSQRSEIGQATNALNDNNEAMAQGQAIAGIYAQSVLDTAIAAGQATESTNQFGDAVYTLPDGATVTVDAETGQATLRLAGVDQAVQNTDGSTATVYANAQTGNAETALNYVVRDREARIRVNVQSRLGAQIEV